jgi:TatD DNase family protein
MFIDTHCHLSVNDYDDIDKIIKDDLLEVDKIIISGCDYEGIFESLEIANNYDNIYVTIGYHPDQVDVVKDTDLENLEKLLKNKKVVGIGEIGLDYHYDDTKKEKQIELFEKQLELAVKYDMPVVIHSRDATKDTINTLKKYKVKGIIHAFSGSLETAEIYIKMGFLLGIGGVITFKNTNLKETIKEVPIDRILLETDSPYLAPTPFRGEKNESKYIPLIAEEIAKNKDITIEELSEKTEENVHRIFGI